MRLPSSRGCRSGSEAHSRISERARSCANPGIAPDHAANVLPRVSGSRNAAIPIVTVLGLQFAQLLGGAVVTETIFAWPGVGRLAVQAIFVRDYPVVQAGVFVLALSFVAINLVVDLLYGWLDPRTRAQEAA